eukprot:Rmarinus@m.26567
MLPNIRSPSPSPSKSQRNKPPWSHPPSLSKVRSPAISEHGSDEDTPVNDFVPSSPSPFTQLPRYVFEWGKQVSGNNFSPDIARPITPRAATEDVVSIVKRLCGESQLGWIDAGKGGYTAAATDCSKWYQITPSALCRHTLAGPAAVEEVSKEDMLGLFPGLRDMADKVRDVSEKVNAYVSSIQRLVLSVLVRAESIPSPGLDAAETRPRHDDDEGSDSVAFIKSGMMDLTSFHMAYYLSLVPLVRMDIRMRDGRCTYQTATTLSLSKMARLPAYLPDDMRHTVLRLVRGVEAGGDIIPPRPSYVLQLEKKQMRKLQKEAEKKRKRLKEEKKKQEEAMRQRQILWENSLRATPVVRKTLRRAKRAVEVVTPKEEVVEEVVEEPEDRKAVVRQRFEHAIQMMRTLGLFSHVHKTMVRKENIVKKMKAVGREKVLEKKEEQFRHQVQWRILLEMDDERDADLLRRMTSKGRNLMNKLDDLEKKLTAVSSEEADDAGKVNLTDLIALSQTKGKSKYIMAADETQEAGMENYMKKFDENKNKVMSIGRKLPRNFQPPKNADIIDFTGMRTHHPRLPTCLDNDVMVAVKHVPQIPFVPRGRRRDEDPLGWDDPKLRAQLQANEDAYRKECVAHYEWKRGSHGSPSPSLKTALPSVVSPSLSNPNASPGSPAARRRLSRGGSRQSFRLNSTDNSSMPGEPDLNSNLVYSPENRGSLGEYVDDDTGDGHSTLSPKKRLKPRAYSFTCTKTPYTYCSVRKLAFEDDRGSNSSEGSYAF